MFTTGGVGRFSITNVVSATSQNIPFHPNEPSGPSVRTAVPGPKSLQQLTELSRLQVKQDLHPKPPASISLKLYVKAGLENGFKKPMFVGFSGKTFKTSKSLKFKFLGFVSFG